MATDINIWKEKILERRELEGGIWETLIRKTPVYHAKNYRLGSFLIESFGLENCVRTELDPSDDEVYDRIAAELDPSDDEDKENDGDLNALLKCITEAKENDDGSEYFWELWY